MQTEQDKLHHASPHNLPPMILLTSLSLDANYNPESQLTLTLPVTYGNSR